MRRLSYFVCSSLAVAACVAGCGQPPREGPETVPVTGTVTLDGEPVPGAHVSFSPKSAGPAAFAETDSRGRFTLRTFDIDDGAVAGTYVVTVRKTVSRGGMEFEDERAKEEYLRQHGGEAPKAEIVSELPARYADPKSSGLTADVTFGTKNHVELELKSD